jgi:hypothetical protein
MYATDKWRPRVNFSGPIELVCDDGHILCIEPDPKDRFKVTTLPPEVEQGPPGHATWHTEKPRARHPRYTHCPYTGRHVLKAKASLRHVMLEDIEHGKMRSDDQYVAVAERFDPLLDVHHVRTIVEATRAWAKAWHAAHGTRTKEEVDRGKR